MRFLSATQLTRSFVCRSLALLPLLVDERAPAAEPVPSDVEVVPLDLCGGAYCLNYTLDEQQFRAVVDTGSPFVLVDGTCGAKFVAAGENNVWGCYRGDGRPSGLKDTEELFGGEDVGTQWRRGSLAIEPAGRLASVDDAIFGVVRSYVGKGGGGAVFFGLAKRRLPRIRPTFLEQTAIRALRFDFVQRTLALSAAPLIPSAADAVRTIDLRPRGAPVATYAARISRLVVNGEAVSLDRAAVAIVDTGTTGLSVCDELFDSGRVPTQWRDARIELATERGGYAALEASIRRRRPAAPGIPPPRLPPDAAEYDEFPLVVSPVRVPWFEPGFGTMECADGEGIQCNGLPVGARRTVGQRVATLADGLGPKPYVLFVGLSFLWQRQLTIDIDEGRMMIT